jgi:hypothetical protein
MAAAVAKAAADAEAALGASMAAAEKAMEASANRDRDKHTLEGKREGAVDNPNTPEPAQVEKGGRRKSVKAMDTGAFKMETKNKAALVPAAHRTSPALALPPRPPSPPLVPPPRPTSPPLVPPRWCVLTISLVAEPHHPWSHLVVCSPSVLADHLLYMAGARGGGGGGGGGGSGGEDGRGGDRSDARPREARRHPRHRHRLVSSGDRTPRSAPSTALLHPLCFADSDRTPRSAPRTACCTLSASLIQIGPTLSPAHCPAAPSQPR